MLHRISNQEVKCMGDVSLKISNQDICCQVTFKHVTYLTCNIMRISVKLRVASQQLWLLIGYYLCLATLMENSKM